jgi:hypothetical protein
MDRQLMIGAIVHYVDTDKKHMAAIVTAVHDHDNGEVSLIIFAPDEEPYPFNRRVRYSATDYAGTWHWPEP